MTDDGSEVVICSYRVPAGREEEFLALLRRHGPTLRRLGLLADEPTRAYRSLAGKLSGEEAPEETTFVEVFTWKDRRAVSVAHEHPDVAAIWEPMGAICTGMSFPHYRPVDLG